MFWLVDGLFGGDLVACWLCVVLAAGVACVAYCVCVLCYGAFRLLVCGVLLCEFGVVSSVVVSCFFVC